MWESRYSTNMGLPPPGSELKLVPMEGKLDTRVRGPHITPGYWRQPELTAKAFDEEGFYRLGDALKFEDPANPGQGLLFDGRTAEDFKLATGTWVSVGPMRAQLVEHFAPYAKDVVIAGADRDDIGILIFPDPAACRSLARDLPPDAPLPDVLVHRNVLAEMRSAADQLCQAGDRQLQPCLPGAPADRAALARRRRDHRQRLAQSAHGAASSRRPGERTLRRSGLTSRHRHRRQSQRTIMTGLAMSFADAWLLDGVRTPFADYNGALANVSPTDLGIKAARAVFDRSDVKPADVGMVITGNMAQASFDAFLLPRHVGLYSGVPIEVPAEMVQRVCGTGIEIIMKASDAVSQQRAELALCVGTESMSRNPIAAYTHRGGFRLGQVEFKDFLWEALMDPAASANMGDTAENLARQYQITRPEVDALRGQELRARDRSAEVGLPGGRDRAGDERDLRTRELQAARPQAEGREGTGHRHPCAALAARGAGENPTGVRRRADRRQLVGHRRRRGSSAGGLIGLREEKRQGRRSPAS